MKKSYFVFAIFALILLVYACRKDKPEHEDTDQTITFSVNDAKRYLKDDLYSGSPYIRIKSIDKDKPKLSGFLFWTRSRTYKSGIYEVVEIPMNIDARSVSLYNIIKDSLKTAPDVSVATASFSRLIVYKSTQTGNIDKRIITYIPDKSYLAVHHNDASSNWIDRYQKDFSGYIEYKLMDGTVQFLIRIKQGKGVARYNVTVLEKSYDNFKPESNTKPSNIKPLDVYCYPYYVQEYVQVCYTNGEGGYTCGEMRPDGFHYEYVCYDNGYNPGGGNDPGNSYPPGGGGGGGGNPGLPPSSEILEKILKNTNSLTQEQKNQVEYMIVIMKMDCVGNTLYQYLVDNNIKLDIIVDSNAANPALYNPTNDVLTLRDPGNMGTFLLTEEIMHAYQNKTISGGTTQYSGNQPGSTNLEFETKLIRDINAFMTGKGMGNAIASDEYISYYINLANNNPTSNGLPKSFTSTEMSQYFYFVQKFLDESIKNDNVYKNTRPNSLPPSMMFSIGNSPSCSN